MGAYLIRRLLIAIPSLLGISLVLFTVLALAPGDPFGELASNPNEPPTIVLPNQVEVSNGHAGREGPGLHEVHSTNDRIAHLPVGMADDHEIGTNQERG